MRISDAFLTELKSRIRPSDVMGRKVKLKKQGKEWAGLSPFTNEKTPSFYVNDEKGFFKCFSSGKFGDVITFLIETEKLSFMEAVERLAGEAGMEIPKGSEEDVRAFQQRKSLLEWMEAATQFFEDQLRAPVGRDARDYLERRGLGPDAWPRHRIGFAPEGWRNILDYLTELGATPEDIVAAGLAIDIEENDKPPYDRFRNRIIFPILDPSGRPIALGGRTIDPEGKPKYLNSPETSLFHKGRVLYRYGPAREALATIGKSALAGTPLSR
ncbi:MAG: CHC2 zinc finger domain-containing protein, partial [Pseudomonadota bacterium]